MFQALKHRNYRIYFTGQIVSLTGTWMQQIALSWLVYRMTGSVVLLGIVGFAGQITTFLLVPFAGVLVDRYSRHRLLLLTQVAGMVQAAIATALVMTNTITPTYIVLLSLLTGVINALDMPSRQSFTVDMIDDRKHLSNAIALNSTMINSAKLMGPALGGIIIAMWGEGMCFLINTLSYGAIIVSLLLMKIPRKETSQKHRPILGEMKEGFKYAYGFKPIWQIMVLVAIVNFVAGGAQVLMPVFAKEVFHGGAKTLGLLMAASGFGALSGALYLASRKGIKGLGAVIVLSSALFGVGGMAVALSGALWLSVVFLLMSGFGFMLQMSASNTLLQSLVDEDKRGRVMSIYTMSFIGTSPFGSLIAGSFAHQWGAQHVLFAGGILAVIGAVLFAMQLPKMRELARPVLIQKGMLTEPAA